MIYQENNIMLFERLYIFLILQKSICFSQSLTLSSILCTIIFHFFKYYNSRFLLIWQLNFHFLLLQKLIIITCIISDSTDIMWNSLYKSCWHSQKSYRKCILTWLFILIALLNYDILKLEDFQLMLFLIIMLILFKIMSCFQKILWK